MSSTWSCYNFPFMIRDEQESRFLKSNYSSAPVFSPCVKSMHLLVTLYFFILVRWFCNITLSPSPILKIRSLHILMTYLSIQIAIGIQSLLATTQSLRIIQRLLFGNVKGRAKWSRSCVVTTCDSSNPLATIRRSDCLSSFLQEERWLSESSYSDSRSKG